MTLEEAQEKILEQQAIIETLNIEKTTLTNSIEDGKKINKNLSDEITKLREHNMKLFLKLSNEDTTTKVNNTDGEVLEPPTIDDLLTDF